MTTADIPFFDFAQARAEAIQATRKDLDRLERSPAQPTDMDRWLDGARRQVPSPPLPPRPAGAAPYRGLGYGRNLVLLSPVQKILSGPEVYKLVMNHVLEFEGSVFTDDPDDRGGPTRYGIIQRRYDEYRRDSGLPSRSVRFIERTEVDLIYRRYYADPVRFELLPPDIAAAVLDLAINSGVSRGTKFLQWQLGLKQTGKMDDATLSAARSSNAQLVALGINAKRRGFLKGITIGRPSQKKFLKGWLRRVAALDVLIEKKL